MDQTNSTQASSFSCFSKLPREIQLNIWEHSLPPPRAIDFSAQRVRIFATYFYNQVQLGIATVPAILHTCADSREVGLKHYELILDTNNTLELDGLGVGRKPAYVDLARDILFTDVFFQPEVFLEATPETILNRIRYFAYRDYGDDVEMRSDVMSLLRGLPALGGFAVLQRSGLPREKQNQTLGFFKRLRNDGDAVLKIRMFGCDRDFEKGLQQKKLWGAEDEVGWLVSQSGNHQLRMFSS